jgi:hypothetical protein
VLHIAPPQTILHSAELVGLNVLQLMSDNAAGMKDGEIFLNDGNGLFPNFNPNDCRFVSQQMCLHRVRQHVAEITHE